MDMVKPFYSQSIQEALATWNRGGLVAMPTETVYGLAAPVNNTELIEKIFSFKERPYFDPLIVHVSGVEMAQRYSASGDFGDTTKKLMEKFWPGPLTFVVEKSQDVPDLITSGLPTVGLRVPKNQVALKLIREIDTGLAAPSANKFKKTSPTKKEHVFESFQGQDLCVLENFLEESNDSKEENGLDLPEVGIESTIIKVTEVSGCVDIKILRPGILTQRDFKEALQGFGLSEEDFSITVGQTAFEENSSLEAPGLVPVHYLPNFPLFIIEKSEGIQKVIKEYTTLKLEERELPANPYHAARVVYQWLHKPVTSGFDGVLLVIPNDNGLNEKEREIWSSLMNRLQKAGTFLQSTPE